MTRARATVGSAAASIAVLIALAGPAAATSAPSGWASLGQGEGDGYTWAVRVKGPCLLVATTAAQGPLGYQRSRYRRCSSPLVVATGVAPKVGAPATVTAVGMVFARPARAVRATFAGGRTRTIPLGPVPGRERLGYAAFAVEGTWCTERLVSLDRRGRVLWDSGTDEYDCPPANGPGARRLR